MQKIQVIEGLAHLGISPDYHPTGIDDPILESADELRLRLREVLTHRRDTEELNDADFQIVENRLQAYYGDALRAASETFPADPRIRETLAFKRDMQLAELQSMRGGA